MAEDHPLFRAWSEALDRLVEAERRYHIARLEGRSGDEVQLEARDLDDAREAYRAVTDRVEEYDPEAPQAAPQGGSGSEGGDAQDDDAPADDAGG